MYTRSLKDSTSANLISPHKKSNHSEGSQTVSVQPQPDISLAQDPEKSSYSRDAANTLSENVMRSLSSSEQELDSPSTEISSIQTKLTVGAPGDKYEQEADSMAAQVMSMSNPSPQVQRLPEEENPVQMWSLAQSITPVVHRQVNEQVQMQQLVQRAFQPTETQATEDLESRLNASKGGGSALAPEVRSFMEPRFGADFSSVRVHTGGEAVQMNRELGAQAFTHGSDVYFGAGKSPGNNELTAHELTHVVQQTGGGENSLNMVSRAIIQRSGFEPQLNSSPDLHVALLNDDIGQNVNVTNARSAPSGTKFEWKWKSGFDTDKLESRGAAPPEGARSTLKAKTKKVFDETSLIPAVQVTQPDGEVSTTEAPPVSVGVEEPSILWWSSVSNGSVGTGKARTTERLFVGDSLTINAGLSDINSAQTAGIRFSITQIGIAPKVGKFAVSETQWTDATSAFWDVQAQAAGITYLTVDAYIPGIEEPLSQDFEIAAVNDARQFKDRCTTAHTTLDAAYAAGEEFFLNCSRNYKAGYDAHKAALDRQSSADQLTQQLILGVLFATIGGAAGGAIGGAMADTAKRITAATNAATAGAVTDAAKDLAKYVARLPTLARGGGSGGSGGGSGVGVPGGSGRPSHGAGAAGRGSGAAAATDPFGWFLQVQTGFASERRQALEYLRQLQEVADLVLSTHADYEFDTDPVELVTEAARIDGTPLNEMGTPPSADDYERVFWITWLSQYAWKVSYVSDHLFKGRSADVYQNVGGKLRSEIQAVASRFGENADEWIERFGGDARIRAEENARQWENGGIPEDFN